MIYSVIDVETTGGNPKSSKITEIAIYKHDGEKIVDEFVSLVNPEMPIPEFVVNLTKISDQMVENAPKFYEIAKKIIEFTQDTVFVAHNVGFDYGMIRSEFRHLGYDFRLPHLCTVRSARHFIPNQDSYSLGKLTRSLGIELKGRHRAGGDALATAKLLSLLIEKGGSKLNQFIQDELNPSFLHPALNLDLIEEIPNRSGIYKFFDENNQLIYLGKSNAIRTSIEQHLRNRSTKKNVQWCSNIARVEFELTGTELIASILEHQLLKQGRPKFNRTIRKKAEDIGLFGRKISEHDFNGESFYLLGKGRHKQEKSLLLIEHGSFSGYGFAPFHLHRLDPIFWKRFISLSWEDEVIQRLIVNSIKKNKLEKILV
jgi:DNA polymerase-3 subunit epsilon